MEVFELILIGLGAGLAGGMLGVGGSIVMIPAMTEVLGPDQHLYQAAAMIVNFFVVVPAVYQHRRAKAIDTATVLRTVPLAIVAVVAGVGISELPLFAGRGEAYLRGLFGLFLFGVAGFEFFRLFRRARPGGEATGGSGDATGDAAAAGWGRVAAVAIPTGFVAGLLGVGGGILAVPLQLRLLRIPIRNAIANSATIIIATSLVGATVKNYAYVMNHDQSLRSFGLALMLIPTAIVGSLIGSRLTHRLPMKVVKTAFFILLAVAAVRLTYNAARSLEAPPEEVLQPDRAASAPGAPGLMGPYEPGRPQALNGHLEPIPITNPRGSARAEARGSCRGIRAG